MTEFDGVLTGISGSFCNFRVISGNSVNSGNSVIPLKFPLNFRVIPGFRKYNLFPLDFRQSEFRNSGIPEFHVTRNSVNFPVTHCLSQKSKQLLWLFVNNTVVAITIPSSKKFLNKISFSRKWLLIIAIRDSLSYDTNPNGNNVTFEHNSFLNVDLKCRLRRGCDVVDRNEGRHRFTLCRRCEDELKHKHVVKRTTIAVSKHIQILLNCLLLATPIRKM